MTANQPDLNDCVAVNLAAEDIAVLTMLHEASMEAFYASSAQEATEAALGEGGFEAFKTKVNEAKDAVRKLRVVGSLLHTMGKAIFENKAVGLRVLLTKNEHQYFVALTEQVDLNSLPGTDEQRDAAKTVVSETKAQLQTAKDLTPEEREVAETKFAASAVKQLGDGSAGAQAFNLFGASTVGKA
jgi:hypothetical protein